jgi:hypothetical protein
MFTQEGMATGSAGLLEGPPEDRLHDARGGSDSYSTFPWRCMGPVGAGTPGTGSRVTANASKV